jgi:hypothetical protein
MFSGWNQALAATAHGDCLVGHDGVPSGVVDAWLGARVLVIQFLIHLDGVTQQQSAPC